MDPEILILDDDEKAALYSIPDFSPDIYDQLKEIKLVEEPEILVRGVVCHQRRDVGFFSDVIKGYEYSGQVAKAFSFKEAPYLEDVMKLVNKKLKTNFNGVLVNRYRNGEKYISAHSDNEKGLDPNKNTVASIAYGPGIRKFRIRKRVPGKSGPIILDHLHQPCELLVMEGLFQQRYTHEIPVEKKVKDERISLTFRCHETKEKGKK
jgi:alkylated DNA repair dioxygenase AlkB